MDAKIMEAMQTIARLTAWPRTYRGPSELGYSYAGRLFSTNFQPLKQWQGAENLQRVP